MSIRKTLGGDRLGSGKKMEVELHGFERSTHDLGYLFRTTLSAGTLVPYMCEIALPGDTFDIKLDCDVKTHPTVGPLFGSYKVQLDTFLIPIRLYNSLLHNNKLGIGMNMSGVKFPQLGLNAYKLDDNVEDVDNSQINPSSILSYLGIRGVGINNEALPKMRYFNGTPLLAYWEIYKNYYANKQEGKGAVIHTELVALVQTVSSIKVNNVTTVVLAPLTTTANVLPNDTIVIAYSGAQPIPEQIYFNTNLGIKNLAEFAGFSGTGTGTVTYTVKSGIVPFTIENWRYKTKNDVGTVAPTVATFDLESIDWMRDAILTYQQTSSAFNINQQSYPPYVWTYADDFETLNVSYSQEGLAVKTYQSDLFNNWLDTEWIDGTTGVNAISAVDTSSGEFTIDTLNLAKKVYDMLNRIAVSGGSYDDWLDAVYAHDRIRRVQSPMYMGGLSKELVFQEVVSNAAAEGEALGSLAGKGVMSKKHKGGDVIIKVDEPSYIMGIVSLTPRIDYSQGNKWDVNLKTMDDLHKPSLDQIGFQDLVTDQLAWWDTTWDNVNNKWVFKSAGKQPAWINYMTNVNQVRGNFAITDNEMFMTLNRRYERAGGTINDLTSYIDPVKFNFIFADSSLDAQNFWCQIAVDITARRKMSAKVMPNV